MDILIAKLSAQRFVSARLVVNQRWLSTVVPLGVFLVVLLPRLAGLGVFLTADEDDQIMFASLFLKSILQGDFAGALVLGYPGVPTLILGGLGVGLRYLAHYAGWLPLPWVKADLMTTLDQVTLRFGMFEYPLDFITWVRVPLALTASICLLGIYLLAARLLNRRLALLATLIIAFDPLILAHTRIVHVDAPLSYFMFLSFLAFLLYVDKGGWRWLLLSGFCGGLAALSKTPAGLLGPILVVSGCWYALFAPPGQPLSLRWKRLIVALLGWGVVAVGAFVALWPAMWTRPTYALTWIIDNIRSVSDVSHPTTGIFWDVQQSDQNPLYYAIALPYHLTPLTSMGIVLGLVLIAAGLVNRWRRRPGWAATSLPLALSLVSYVVLFTVPVSLIARRGDRYILPIFFAVGFLTALALWWLVGPVSGWLRRLWPLPAGQVSLHLAGILVLLQGFQVLLYHPYYLAYYNPLLGGYRNAPYHVNIGWGEGLDAAARYLNKLNGASSARGGAGLPRVAAWYSNQFAPYYTGQTIDLSNESAALTGDYTVFYINQVQRGFPSGEILTYFQQREPLQIIKLGGVPYVWIYPGPVVSKEPPSHYAFPVEVLLGGGARLIGLDVPQLTMPVDAYARPAEDGQIETFVRGEAVRYGLPVTLYWETLAQINGEHNMYIRLVDAQGNTWGQVDRLILAGLWRPDRWYSGYFLRDEYRLPVDPATPPGVYSFEVGMYDFDTGQSYGVVKNIGQVTLTPPQELPVLADPKLKPVPSLGGDEPLRPVEHTYEAVAVPPGAEIAGKVFWQASQPLAKDYTVQFSFLSAGEGKKYIVAETSLASTAYRPSQWRRQEIVGAAYRFRVPAEAPAGTYPLQVQVVDPDSGAAVGPAVSLAEVTVEAYERTFSLPANVTPVSAVINGEIELVGYRLLNQTVAPKESFGLVLYWRSLKLASSNYTVFVHAVGPDQVMRGQWDSMPVGGTAPTSGWLPGEIVEDTYQVPMAKDAPPWKYDIFVGMYDSLSGQRLPVTGRAPISDNRAWLTRVQVVEQEQ